jgi:hypothetical protein
MMKHGHTGACPRGPALALAPLAACGVDGEPEQPTRAAVRPPAYPHGTRTDPAPFSNISDRADTRLNPRPSCLPFLLMAA